MGLLNIYAGDAVTDSEDPVGLLKRLLREESGIVERCAPRLGISRNQVYLYVQRYGLRQYAKQVRERARAKFLIP